MRLEDAKIYWQFREFIVSLVSVQYNVISYVTTTALLTQNPVDCSMSPGQMTRLTTHELGSEV